MKIIKVENCFDCDKSYKNMITGAMVCANDDFKGNNPVIDDSSKLHEYCPLDDICDCERFQSCSRCERKTEWIDPLIILPGPSEKYWILDTRDNFIKKGVQWGGTTFEYEDGTMIYFENSMFAEIKPPEVI